MSIFRIQPVTTQPYQEPVILTVNNGTSLPLGITDEGDLFHDTTTDTLYIYIYRRYVGTC